MATVYHILKRKGYNVYTISPDASVFDALKMLVEKKVGSLIVTDEKGQYVGTLTERDYARKVILKGRSSTETYVHEIMDKHPSVTENSSLEECMKKMSEKRFRHLPVMDCKDRLVGVVSLGDVVKFIIEEQRFLLESMGDYIAGTHH